MSRRKGQLRIVPKETITLHGLRWDDRQEPMVTRYEIMRWSVRDDGFIYPWLDDDENYYGDFCDFVIELPGGGGGYQASLRYRSRRGRCLLRSRKRSQHFARELNR